jgi:hypothetical protein
MRHTSIDDLDNITFMRQKQIANNIIDNGCDHESKVEAGYYEGDHDEKFASFINDTLYFEHALKQSAEWPKLEKDIESVPGRTRSCLHLEWH